MLRTLVLHTGQKVVSAPFTFLQSMQVQYIILRCQVSGRLMSGSIHNLGIEKVFLRLMEMLLKSVKD